MGSKTSRPAVLHGAKGAVETKEDEEVEGAVARFDPRAEYRAEQWDWILEQNPNLDPEKYETGMNIEPDLLGFKYVPFWYDKNLCCQSGGAILWLQIPSKKNKIVQSDGGKVVVPAQDGLRRKIKYATGQVRVIGVHFVGKPEDVKKMTMAYQQGMGFLRSNHASRFEYETDSDAYEPAVGKPGDNGCVQGIHFFIHPGDALDFWSPGRVCDDQWPIITQRLKTTRQVGVAVTREFLQRYNKPEPAERLLYSHGRRFAWQNAQKHNAVPNAERKGPDRIEFIGKLILNSQARHGAGVPAGGTNPAVSASGVELAPAPPGGAGGPDGPEGASQPELAGPDH